MTESTNLDLACLIGSPGLDNRSRWRRVRAKNLFCSVSVDHFKFSIFEWETLERRHSPLNFWNQHTQNPHEKSLMLSFGSAHLDQYMLHIPILLILLFSAKKLNQILK